MATTQISGVDELSHPTSSLKMTESRPCGRFRNTLFKGRAPTYKFSEKGVSSKDLLGNHQWRNLGCRRSGQGMLTAPPEKSKNFFASEIGRASCRERV